jgi:hypothetical protein
MFEIREGATNPTRTRFYGNIGDAEKVMAR